MQKFPVVLDIETKHTFREFAEPHKLGVTVAVIYDFKDNQPKIFTEQELGKLFPILESASYIVGYNVRSFDMAVLQGYYPGDVTHFSVFDILEDIKEKIGRRIALNDVIKATLEKQKTGHGLQAIQFYKEGRWDELKKYCQDDVMLTKELFDYGVKNGQIYYMNEIGKSSIYVEWKKYMLDSGKQEMVLTLPF
jgi:DEAD/DEAH box helicase domain-containing protein